MTQGEAYRLARAAAARQEGALFEPCGVHRAQPCGQPPVGIIENSDPPIPVCAAGKDEIERQGYNVVMASQILGLRP
jgi:hypothetical protein